MLAAPTDLPPVLRDLAVVDLTEDVSAGLQQLVEQIQATSQADFSAMSPSAFESLVADLLRAVGFRPGDGGGVGHQPAGRGRADYWGQASRRPALMRRRKGFVRAGTSARPSSERDAHSRETAPTSRHLLVEAQSPLPGTPRASSRKP